MKSGQYRALGKLLLGPGKLHENSLTELYKPWVPLSWF